MKNAVVLVSGGMDSAVVLAIAREQGFAVHALSVRYGQRHTSELDAADRDVGGRGARVVRRPRGGSHDGGRSGRDPDQLVPGHGSGWVRKQCTKMAGRQSVAVLDAGQHIEALGTARGSAAGRPGLDRGSVEGFPGPDHSPPEPPIAIPMAAHV